LIIELDYSYSDLYDFTQRLRPLGEDIFENSWREATKLIETAVRFHIDHGHQDTLMMLLFEIRQRFESLDPQIMMTFAQLITMCVCEIREHIREHIRVPARALRIRSVRVIEKDIEFMHQPLVLSVNISHHSFQEVYS